MQGRNRLEEKLHSISSTYWKKYSALKNRLIENEFKFWQINAPEFTDHSENHCVRVMERLVQLIPENIIEKMSCLDLYFLLCATWLHDIGMLTREHKGEKYSPEEVREMHHELSRIAVLEKYREYSIQNKNEANYIAKICYCHRVIPIAIELRNRREVVGSEEVYPRFLAGLLRLADELDLDYRRAPECVSDTITPDGVSKKHWKRCQNVKAVECDSNNSRITITCECDTSDEVESIIMVLRKVNRVRKEVYSFFEYGIKYDQICGKIKNITTNEEILYNLNDVSQTVYQRTLQKSEGRPVVLCKTDDVEKLRDSFRRIVEEQGIE